MFVMMLTYGECFAEFFCQCLLLPLQCCLFFIFPGDHFGIYLDSKVTSFPFNVLEHPMYTGATLNFLGSALK